MSHSQTMNINQYIEYKAKTILEMTNRIAVCGNRLHKRINETAKHLYFSTFRFDDWDSRETLIHSIWWNPLEYEFFPNSRQILSNLKDEIESTLRINSVKIEFLDYDLENDIDEFMIEVTSDEWSKLLSANLGLPPNYAFRVFFTGPMYSNEFPMNVRLGYAHELDTSDLMLFHQLFKGFWTPISLDSQRWL